MRAGDEGDANSSTPLSKAACHAALTGDLAVLSAFLTHLQTAPAPVDALLAAAAAAAEVQDSAHPEQRDEAVKSLLLAAGRQDNAGTQAALQQHFPLDDRAAGALFARVFMDAMLEAAARVEDVKAQKQAVQHLFTATMASAKAQAAAKGAQQGQEQEQEQR